MGRAYVKSAATSVLYADRRKVVQLLRSVYYKQVLIMRCFIVICLGLVLAVDGSARVRRDECDQLQADNEKCANEAYQAYTEASGKQDGREHFMARKSCNYMTAVLDTCMDKMVGNCITQEQLDEQKYTKIVDLMEKLKQSVKEWDPEKCPPFKRYLEQKQAKEDAANPADPEPALAPASGKQQSEDNKTDDDKTEDNKTEDNKTEDSKTDDEAGSGSTTLVASALFSIILSLFI